MVLCRYRDLIQDRWQNQIYQMERFFIAKYDEMETIMDHYYKCN